jgi:hypothetical protein
VANIPSEDDGLVQPLVDHYIENISLIRGFLGSFDSHFLEAIREGDHFSIRYIPESCE